MTVSNQQDDPNFVQNKNNVERNCKVSVFRRILPQILAVSAKNSLALNFGLSIAFLTMIIPALMDPKSEISLNQDETSWIGSLFFIIIPVGCLLSGPITHRFGRKTVMLLFCVPFSAAWWLYYRAYNSIAIYAAVLLHGFISGLLETPLLTYVAEVCEPEWRGMLASTTVLASLAGISLQFFMGSFIDWRVASMINSGFPIISLILIFFIPESPHWLIDRGRIDDAEKALRWLRGWVAADDVKVELNTIIQSIEQSKQTEKTPFSWRPYLSRVFFKPFILVVTTFFIGHFSGMSTFQTYAVGIFEELKSPVNAYSATAAEGFLQFLGSVICMTSLPLIGKRKLAMSTHFCTAIALICLVIFNAAGWSALILLLFAVFTINSCAKVLPWILIGEVFSPRVRAVASGLASGIGYFLAFLVNKTYFLSVKLLTFHGVLLMYGIISLAACGFFYFMLPETEGQSLAEVHAHFKGEINLIKDSAFKKRKDSVDISGLDNVTYVQDGDEVFQENNTIQ